MCIARFEQNVKYRWLHNTCKCSSLVDGLNWLRYEVDKWWSYHPWLWKFKYLYCRWPSGFWKTVAPRPQSLCMQVSRCFYVVAHCFCLTTYIVNYIIVAKNGGDKGLNMEIPFQLEERLKKAGAVNVSMRMAPTPINHGGEIGDICWWVPLSCRCIEHNINWPFIHIQCREDFYEAFYGMQALIAQVHPEMGDADYFKNYLLECKEECHEYKTSLQWYRCIGQKPLDVTQWA